MKTHKPGIWEFDTQTEIINFSKDYCSLIGMAEKQESLPLKTFVEAYVFQDDRFGFTEIVNSFSNLIFEFGKSQEFEYRIIDKNKRFRFIHLILYFKKNGIVCGINTDVTKAKIKEQEIEFAQERLVASNEKLTGIVENTNSAIAIYRAFSDGDDFVFTYFNPAAEKFDKISKEKVLGKRIREVFPGVEDFGLLSVLRRVWRTGKPEHHPLTWYQDGRVSGWRKNYVFKISSGEIVAIYNDYSELKLSEESLRKFKQAVEQSANSIIITDTQGNIEYVNKKFSELNGYSLDEALGQNPRVLKSGYQPDSLYKDLWDTLIAGKVWKGVFHNKTKTNKRVWVNATISPVFDESNNITNFIGIQEDITRKKEIEDALVARESKMRDIFNAMDDAVFEISDKGIFTYIAPTNTDLLFLEAHEIIGKSLFQIFGKERAEEYLEYIGKSIKIGKTIVKEYDLEIKGKLKWFEGRITPKSKSGVTFITRDITQRKLAQDKLTKSESKFRTIFEKSSDAVLILKEGKFIDCNSAAVKMLNYPSKEQLLFKHPKDLSPPYQEDGKNSEVKAEEMMSLAIKHGTHRFEWYHTKYDGKIFPVEVLLTTMENMEGEQEIHTVWRDITDRKREEAELLKAKEKAERADRFKSAFLANMSHEIRTPMNGILGFTELLMEESVTNEEKGHFVQIIKRSGLNMLNIINDILDISKIEAGEMELNINEHNVIETMNYLYEFFKVEMEKKSLNWTRDYDINVECIINIDQFKFNELLTNLIKNAMKYTYEGEINLGVIDKGDELEFYVKDNGIGIPYEKQDMIFERFSQADNDVTHMVYGTGLGLALSKAYVELHQGKIWLNSEPGKGSTFYFTIPKKIEIKE